MKEIFAGKYAVKIGYAPTRRPRYSETAFRLDVARGVKERLAAKLGAMGVEYADIEFLNDEGLLYDGRDALRVAEHFRREGVDALFIPHVNFGSEEAVCRLAAMLKKPVLLWAPRDEMPEAEGYRFRDAQCGLFATSKVLQRFGLAFTYITNCELDSPVFEEGFRTFAAAAGVAKAMVSPRIGQISVRPSAFWSVKSNEAELLERFGVEVVPITLVEVQQRFREVLANRGELFQREKELVLSRAARVEVEDEALDSICAMKAALQGWAIEEQLAAATTQCWGPFTAISGIAPCYLMGDSTDDGFPIVCENDVHGALTSVIALGVSGASASPFCADMTIRHPEQENAELLWHCGVFPPSLANEKGATIGCHQGRKDKDRGAGQFELRPGDLTILRFDGLNGRYKLLFGETTTTTGPYSKGSYAWVDFVDWPLWEHKFIYGPYIHHCTGIYGRYAKALYEAVKYMPGVEADPVLPTADEIERRLRGV